MFDSVVRNYLFQDFRLKPTRDKVILGIIAFVFVILAFLGWNSVLDGRNPFVIWIWFPYSILGSLIGYFILSFLDRERRVRSFHFLLILSVMLVTGPVAAFFNALSPAMLVTVGFIEEGMKIVPVILLAIYLPNLIRTRKDGIVYGALAGMGFNIIEIGLYIANQMHDNTVLESIFLHSTRFGLFGFGGHIVWSAFVGFGVGLAAESTKHGWAKWSRTVYFYLIAAISHTLYDLGANAVGMTLISFVEAALRGMDTGAMLETAGTAPGPINDGMRYGVYVWTSVLIIIMIVQVRRSFRQENEIQISELSAEEPPVVTADELEKLKHERLFSKRKYRDFPRRVGAKMVLYQNMLAILKHRVAQEALVSAKADPVSDLRTAIASKRNQSTT